MRRSVAGILGAVSVVAALTVGATGTTTSTTSTKSTTSTTSASSTTSTRPSNGSASSAGSGTSLANVEKLLALIPSATRESCFRQDPSNLAHGSANVLAAVQCIAPADGVNSVLYIQYDDPTALATAYAASYPAELPPASGGDTACNGTATWYFGAAPAGSYACFTSGTTPTVVWYGGASKVLGIATGTDPTALMTWWHQSAGPTSGPDAAPNFVPRAGAAQKATQKKVSKALLASRGSALTHCKSKLAGAGPGDAEWAFAPWLAAAEACAAPQHGSVYLAQVAPGAAHAYEYYYVNQTLVGKKKATLPTGCVERDLLDGNKKVVGKLNCFQIGKVLYASWYASDDGVVGAVHVATTPEKLFAYLDQHKLL